MKLNFKALIASVVLCSTQFSVLPVYNNLILAMNPAENKSNGIIYRRRNLIYCIDRSRSVVLIKKCPNNILTKEVLCDVLKSLRSKGFNPEYLVLGRCIKDIAQGAFKNPYTYDDHIVENARNRITRVIVDAGSELDKKMQKDFYLYSMCAKLPNLEFGAFHRGVGFLPYDYRFDIDMSKQTPDKKYIQIHKEVYDFWSLNEISLLKQVIKKATNLE